MYCKLDDEVAQIHSKRGAYLRERVLTPPANKVRREVLSAKGSLDHRKINNSKRNKWAKNAAITRHMPKNHSQLSRPFHSKSRMTYQTNKTMSRVSSPELGLYVTKPKIQQKSKSKIGVKLLRQS